MSRALALVESSDEPKTTPESIRNTTALLETKFYVPQTRSELVPRPRLLAAIEEGATRKLTVVVAPAGFGKTTLLAAWLGGSDIRAKTAGWVSLDAAENEPALFWTYFARALQKIHPGVGTHAIAQLQSAHAPPVEAVLTTLINEINTTDSDYTIILDDYHVIDAEAIHGAMTFLLDHMPRRLHLVIASRADPPLALARLRARGELTELHVADMRFSLDEASVFLNTVMSLDLSKKDTATLEQSTEGWIAGLKLAALSMKRRTDIHDFVDGFSGDNRYIADYLVQEVLQSEPERVRRFLLSTSILDRLSGSLCDAVVGEQNTQALLGDLERRNLFVTALDDRREWFRYHHLFAEVLQTQSARSDPDLARVAHSRASLWYEKHGAIAEATRHAVNAGDIERTAHLLECSWPTNDRSYASRLWLDRTKTLPEHVIQQRPVLCMAFAWGLLNSGELEAVEPRLRIVEAWLQTLASDASESHTPARATMVVSDQERFRALTHELEAARVYLAQALGVVPGTLEHAQRALERIPEHDGVGRATGIALVALAHWGEGNLDEAHRTFSRALDAMRGNGHVDSVARGIFVLGDIRAAQGRLREAAQTYEAGLKYSSEQAHSAPLEIDELYLGLAEVHREWNQLGEATAYLDTMVRSADQAAHIGNRMRWCSVMSSIRIAQGEFDDALALLAEGERNERRDPLPRARPIDATRARIHLAQGKAIEAADWIRRRNLSVDDDLSYLREYEHITLARVLLSQGGNAGLERNLNDADRLLDRLRLAAQTGHRNGTVIEVLALHSIVHHKLGALRRALDVLADALALAEPEGYMRVFLDEGTPMRELLRHATARGLAGEYTRHVLAGFEKTGPLASNKSATVVAAASAMVVTDSAHTLTGRELEIVRLIATGMRNQEIAGHLSISGATVKRHIANAYGKLGASHRTEALLRAKELKLL